MCSRKCGGHMRFGCDDNYVLRGQRTLTCDTTGHWSGQQPRCERGVERGFCSILSPPPTGCSKNVTTVSVGGA
ncbi:hypothetical protein CEXT_230751 [Caerostris extrusa]|uniref:Sushi domain-containing protein n=1 Tax=Caerostris extrusa TaxID=172846 RepID=A0AAV4VXF5_CAEEX|nr:hypothetical protein CEXT_230751 [Caerostris extrusa]